MGFIFLGWSIVRKTIKVGVLYSENGPYGSMGRDCRDGADFAIREIANDPSCSIQIEPVYADPAGDPRRYLEESRAMLRDQGCRQIVGTITSQARKEVIPLVEKYDGLLWYVCAYEGFEANENVIYTGTCPNQHLIPLLDYLLPTFGKKAYVVGANFVWGWEMSRIARELLGHAGGEVLGEHYLPMDDVEVDRLVADIAIKRPNFILNNLVGPSSYAFLAAIAELGKRDQAFRPENCPVVSCDLAECELPFVKVDSAVGQYSVGPYFDSLQTEENRLFKKRVEAWHGAERRLSVFFEGAYTAMKLLAASASAAGTDDPVALKAVLHAAKYDTPHGPLRIDARTNHAALPFHLGRIRADGGFDIALSRPAITADPYLTFGQREAVRPFLRVVQ